MTNQTGIRWCKTSKPTGDRYRYIRVEDALDTNRYFYLDELFSRGCPIMKIEDFEETIKILHDLQFKSNGKDSINVVIKEEKTEDIKNDKKNK